MIKESIISLKMQMIFLIAGGDIRQKLEFHHVHLELGALGYIETFLFYWSWVFFQKKKPPRPIFVFENTIAKIKGYDAYLHSISHITLVCCW